MATAKARRPLPAAGGCYGLVPHLHKVAGRHGVSFVPEQELSATGYAYSGLLLRKQL